jgi:hypothetical protein
MIHGIEILAMIAICRIQVCFDSPVFLHRFRVQVSAKKVEVVVVKGHDTKISNLGIFYSI